MKLFNRFKISRSLGFFGLSWQPVPDGQTNVSGELAMTISTFYRCMNVISDSVASLPLQYKRLNKAAGYYVNNDSDRLFELLTISPSVGVTAFDFFKNVVLQRYLQGNAYVLICKTGTFINSLTLLSPGAVMFNKLSKQYTVNDQINGISGTYTPADIIHIKNQSLGDPFEGVSMINYMCNCISSTTTCENEQKKLFQTGGRTKGILASDNGLGSGFGGLNNEQKVDAVARMQSDINKGSDILNVPANSTFTPLTIKPTDMQLLESRKFSSVQICQFLGVPPEKAFASESGNYKSSDLAQISFLSETLRPILRQIEAEFTIKLIPSYLRSDYKLKFDISELYTSDLTTQSAYYKSLIENGLNTPNEIRKKMGIAPMDGGDKLFISANVKPINEIATQ